MSIEGEKKEQGLDGLKKIREFIDLAILKRKGKQEMKISEVVEDFGKDLPEELKLKLEGEYRRLKEKIPVEESLKEEVEFAGRNIREGYMDERLEIPNKAFANMDLISKVDELFEEEPQIDDLKKVAHVYFDLNGLKAANDLGSHGLGDEYLALAAGAIKSEEVKEVAKRHGIDPDYIVCREGGGDEFGVTLKSDKPIEEEALSEFIETAQSVLWNNEKVANVLDFDNPEVVAKFAGVSIDEIKEGFGNDLDKFKEAHNIPKDYKYKGAISAGASRIYDALLDDKIKDKNTVKVSDSYEKILQRVMGATFDTSDAQMAKNKKEFKKNLAEGEVGDDFSGPEEKKRAVLDAKMLSRVYTRTEEEKELVEKLQNRNKLIADIKDFIGAGGDAKGVQQMIERAKELMQ